MEFPEKNRYLDHLVNNKGFVLPNLPLDKIQEVELRNTGYGLRLFVDDISWMGVKTRDYREVYEFYSHHTLAQGRVLCSGMGLMLRESWLLSKGVDITLIEKNENIIEYHRKHNPDLCDRLTIVCDDIHNQVGKYDVVLLDHYEHEKEDWIIEDVKSILKNIDCDTLWFWPLEKICAKNGGWEYYCELRKSISKLPELDETTFDSFLYNFFIHQKRDPLFI